MVDIRSAWVPTVALAADLALTAVGRVLPASATPATCR